MLLLTLFLSAFKELDCKLLSEKNLSLIFNYLVLFTLQLGLRFDNWANLNLCLTFSNYFYNIVFEIIFYSFIEFNLINVILSSFLFNFLLKKMILIYHHRLFRFTKSSKRH